LFFQYEIILGTIRERTDFVIQTPHRIAYMLDPRFFGAGLSKEQRRMTEREIVERVGLEANCAYKELSAFLSNAKQDQDAKTWEYLQLLQGSRTPAQYWDLASEYPLLKHLAKRVFVLIASSASSERLVVLLVFSFTFS
jgi:hypothetical protein